MNEKGIEYQHIKLSYDWGLGSTLVIHEDRELLSSFYKEYFMMYTGMTPTYIARLKNTGWWTFKDIAITAHHHPVIWRESGEPFDGEIGTKTVKSLSPGAIAEVTISFRIGRILRPFPDSKHATILSQVDFEITRWLFSNYPGEYTPQFRLWKGSDLILWRPSEFKPSEP